MGDQLPPTITSVTRVIDQPSLDVVVIAGHIKWFDASKGFGFIVPDGGLPDILLHVTVLRRDGFQTAYEGARIVCETPPSKRIIPDDSTAGSVAAAPTHP
jgi:CspA family cold shock protein